MEGLTQHTGARSTNEETTMRPEETTTTGARSSNEVAWHNRAVWHQLQQDGLSNLEHQEAVWHQQQQEENRTLEPLETLESLEAARYDLRTGVREEETELGRQRERERRQERRLDGTDELEAALTRELNRHQQRTQKK